LRHSRYRPNILNKNDRFKNTGGGQTCMCICVNVNVNVCLCAFEDTGESRGTHGTHGDTRAHYRQYLTTILRQ
jgi:hypothetical protein